MKKDRETVDWLGYRLEAWCLSIAVPAILSTIVWTIDLYQLDQNYEADKILASFSLLIWIINFPIFINHKRKTEEILRLIKSEKIQLDKTLRITRYVLALHAGHKELRKIFLHGRNQ